MFDDCVVECSRRLRSLTEYPVHRVDIVLIRTQRPRPSVTYNGWGLGALTCASIAPTPGHVEGWPLSVRTTGVASGPMSSSTAAVPRIKQCRVKVKLTLMNACLRTHPHALGPAIRTKRCDAPRNSRVRKRCYERHDALQKMSPRLR